MSDAERQSLYALRVYTPEQRKRIVYWQSMWEKSMHNPKNKPEPVEMPGDLPYPERPDNQWTGSPDPWKGVRGTPTPPNAPCCKFEGDPRDCAFTDKDLSILTEAHGLVHGDRQATYGHPAVDFARTAALANVLLAHRLDTDLGPEDVAMFLVCVKLSRECHEHKRDNLVDACGYLECRERVLRFLGNGPERSKDAL